MDEEADEPELIIGVVAPLGVDTTRAAQAIFNELKRYGYEAVEAKLTASVKELERFSELTFDDTVDRYKRLIDACDDVRVITKLNDIMARFAVSQISDSRRQRAANSNPTRRRAYIVNQLKRKEETDLLRSVYGENYVQISFYSNPEDRAARLADKIADDHPEKPRAEDWQTEARYLIDLDSAEEDKLEGQRVRDVFPLSDVVIDASKPRDLTSQLERFFRLIYGDPRVTPTADEYGMQLASTASLRSSDLSRQVGAAILNQTNEVQALGCNEVPRAGGGTYWEGDDGDAREFQLEKDSNDERKREVLLDLASRMLRAKMIGSEFNDSGKLRDALLKRQDDLISNSQLMDSLEYGRTVHAEMNAITDAARNGHAVRGCKLYCNTFPCHNCAKHIVSSGISEVVYLLPYPKSYAKQLFSDSISVDPPAATPGKVRFRQFVGVVGPIFSRAFAKRRWKTHGGGVDPFIKAGAKLKSGKLSVSYEKQEQVVELELRDALVCSGLAKIPEAKNS